MKLDNVIKTILLFLLVTSCEGKRIHDFSKDNETDSITSLNGSNADTSCHIVIENPSFEIKFVFGKWLSHSQYYKSIQIDTNNIYITGKHNINNLGLCYKLSRNELTIFHGDYNIKGLIKRADSDTLEIYWASGEYVRYTRIVQLINPSE